MDIFSLCVIMINDYRGVAVGRAGFSLLSSELSLTQGLWSRDVHKHAHKIKRLSRWYSVLGRGMKNQIGRMIGAVPCAARTGTTVFSYLSLVESQSLPNSPLIGFHFSL